MTSNEFRDMANKGIVIECLTTQQRREVLELFEENGFAIGPATKTYMCPEGDSNTAYMHPAFKPDESFVCCYRNFIYISERMANAIRYEDVRNLIENSPPLDERSDAEFASDFASLLC